VPNNWGVDYSLAAKSTTPPPIIAHHPPNNDNFLKKNVPDCGITDTNLFRGAKSLNHDAHKKCIFHSKQPSK